MQNQVEKFLARLKDSHPDMELIYTRGGCYQLYLILRVMWPQAIPWYDYHEGHVYTEINGCYYDINGKKLCRGKWWRRMGLDPKRPDRWRPQYRVQSTLTRIWIDHDYDI